MEKERWKKVQSVQKTTKIPPSLFEQTQTHTPRNLDDED